MNNGAGSSPEAEQSAFPKNIGEASLLWAGFTIGNIIGDHLLDMQKLGFHDTDAPIRAGIAVGLMWGGKKVWDAITS
jgi:hypothetical protein